MGFPKSLSEITHLLGYHSSGKNNVNVNQPASPQMMVQGTRAFPTQGTWSHPGNWGGDPERSGGWDDETWTPPITQFDYGDGPEVSNTQTTKTTFPWPPNMARQEGNPNGDRDDQLRTDYLLQVGEAPGRILRQMFVRAFGNDGAMTGEPYGTGGSLPFVESWQYMEHMKVPRQALGTKGPQKLADDNLAIPAIYAGNPRP